jgi:hypothetical protein
MNFPAHRRYPHVALLMRATLAQYSLIDRRLKEDNPDLPEQNRMMIFGVLVTKARCED